MFLASYIHVIAHQCGAGMLGLIVSSKGALSMSLPEVLLILMPLKQCVYTKFLVWLLEAMEAVCISLSGRPQEGSFQVYAMAFVHSHP